LSSWWAFRSLSFSSDALCPPWPRFGQHRHVACARTTFPLGQRNLIFGTARNKGAVMQFHRALVALGKGERTTRSQKRQQGSLRWSLARESSRGLVPSSGVVCPAITAQLTWHC
jgi:hypothetical protein